MSTPVRSLLRNQRPLRALTSAHRGYATISSKNPHPSGPLEPAREQAMPIGRFYEAIRNSGQPIPKVKPEEPATSVKENLQQAAEAEAGASSAKEPAKRGRKPKPKTEPASTATAATAPTASAAASPKATAQEAASKSLVSSSPSEPSPSPIEASSSIEMASPPVPTPPPTATSTEDKAKVIFGSRLAGPTERAERLAQIRAKSTNVAGVMVPPKPQEPDNCCMSGCVNCVWDRYRDEMEEWALANAEAEKRLAATKAAEGSSADTKLEETIQTATTKDDTEATASSPTTATAAAEPVSAGGAALSMDNDGGGSEANGNIGATSPASQAGNKIAKDFWDDELYKNVPVGIREFMKQEKKLKEKHMREGTSGG